MLNKLNPLFCIWIGLLFCAEDLKSQHQQHFSHFLFNQAQYNPASVGTRPYLSIDGLFRSQWLGINGAPGFQALSAQLPIPALKSGFGINIANETYGASRNTGMEVSVSRSIIERSFKLLGGISVGLAQNNLNGSELITPTGIYEDQIDHMDDLLSSENTIVWAPKIGFGLYFYDNNIRIGLSAKNFPAFKTKQGANSVYISEQNVNIHFNAAYRLEFRSGMALTTMLYMTTDGSNLQLNTGFMVSVLKSLDLGISVRGYNKLSIESLVGLIKYDVNPEFSIIYAYDYPILALNNKTVQSHEIGLRYKINRFFIKKGSKIIYNPRFL